MRFASLSFCLAGLATLSAAWAAETTTATPRPLTPPPGASIPAQGAQQRFAKNALGQVIALRDIDDSTGPYAGKYGPSDRWYFEHYVASVTPEEEKHFGG